MVRSWSGTTAGVGANGHGTVFKITPSGTLTTLYGFGSQSTDGYGANAGLVQATNGYLYGTTTLGGLAPTAVAVARSSKSHRVAR